MIDQILQFVSAHLSEILLAMLTALLGFALREARKLLKLFVEFSAAFAAEAKKTPNPGDDIAAAMLQSLAIALNAAVEKALPASKK